MTAPFIAVEGPIGAGKTTLARALSTKMNFRLVEEAVEENPYLSSFYKDKEEWSFQTEMFFLSHRYKQLTDVKKLIEKGHPVAADYHVFKNLIFAKRSLSPDDFIKFEAIYRILTADLPMPSIIVYLDVSTDQLLERIEGRGRSFENSISADDLNQLTSDYEHFLQQFAQRERHVPILRLDGNQMNFVSNPQDIEKAVQQIKQHSR